LRRGRRPADVTLREPVTVNVRALGAQPAVLVALLGLESVSRSLVGDDLLGQVVELSERAPETVR
jgi:hypothetical protein